MVRDDLPEGSFVPVPELRDLRVCLGCGTVFGSGLEAEHEALHEVLERSLQTAQLVVAADAKAWPEGHPCRDCGQLAKHHPNTRCVAWR